MKFKDIFVTSDSGSYMCGCSGCGLQFTSDNKRAVLCSGCRRPGPAKSDGLPEALEALRALVADINWETNNHARLNQPSDAYLKATAVLEKYDE